MRYAGGLLGGIWLVSLLSDLGNGKFDGAWLEANFENLNPGNTLSPISRPCVFITCLAKCRWGGMCWLRRESVLFMYG